MWLTESRAPAPFTVGSARALGMELRVRSASSRARSKAYLRVWVMARVSVMSQEWRSHGIQESCVKDMKESWHMKELLWIRSASSRSRSKGYLCGWVMAHVRVVSQVWRSHGTHGSHVKGIQESWRTWESCRGVMAHMGVMSYTHDAHDFIHKTLLTRRRWYMCHDSFICMPICTYQWLHTYAHEVTQMNESCDAHNCHMTHSFMSICTWPNCHVTHSFTGIRIKCIYSWRNESCDNSECHMTQSYVWSHGHLYEVMGICAKSLASVSSTYASIHDFICKTLYIHRGSYMCHDSFIHMPICPCPQPHTYDSFHWKFYTPEIHQIHKLKFLGTNSNGRAASGGALTPDPPAHHRGRTLALRILVSMMFPYLFHSFLNGGWGVSSFSNQSSRSGHHCPISKRRSLLLDSYSNTLQHTAMGCNTLQHTAT